MSKTSLTHDPFFITVVAAIEKKIAEGDRIARANQIALSDAQILSLLAKVGAANRGKGVKSNRARQPRDQILRALTEQLLLLRESIFEKKIGKDGGALESRLSTEHWIAALAVVQKSIRLGTGHLPGSRGFLDSLGIFIARRAACGTGK